MFDEKFLSSMTEITNDRNAKLQSQVRDLRAIMVHGPSKQLSRGMERVLYDLNPILPCISSKFEYVWIGSVKQMLRAIDRMAASGSVKNILLDRHIAAFCAAHGSDLERDFNMIAAAQHDPAKLAGLCAEFFGILQRRFKLEPLQNLTEKLVEGLGPTLKALRNKKRRERVSQLLEKIKKSGEISKLTSDINLSKLQVEDSREFAQARTAVMRLDREKAKLNRKVLPTDLEARKKGLRGSRIVAFAVGGLIGIMTFLPT
jgi:hypothetical protein